VKTKPSKFHDRGKKMNITKNKIITQINKIKKEKKPATPE
jgi:hypothetical protein